MEGGSWIDALCDNGYHILRGAAKSDLPEYAEAVDRREDPTAGKFDLLSLGPELMTRVLDYHDIRHAAETLCGAFARLDNQFGFSYPGNGVSPNIHGGPFSEKRSVYYQEQADWRQTSNLKVGIAIQPQQGLGILPGSHKSTAKGKDRILPCNVDVSQLQVPVLYGGDIIVFTDALIHGTVHTETPRQMLYYTFTPGHVSWAVYADHPRIDEVPATRQWFFRPAGLVNLDTTNRSQIQFIPPTFN